MKKSVKKSRTNKKSSPKRLLRFLAPKQKLRVFGVRGVEVKKVVSGRKYVLKVYQGKKLVGYINNVKKGQAVPKPFTKSMISRLKYTQIASQYVTRESKPGPKFKLSSNKPIINQLDPDMLEKIRENHGKAFSISVKGDRFLQTGHSIYIDKAMDDRSFGNLITSEILYAFARARVRISPLLKALQDMTSDEKRTERKIRRVENAQLTLNFHDVIPQKIKGKKVSGRKRKTKTIRSTKKN